jgi:1-acyl-sn-glycerol-3-phosphate acyltransferase
MTVFLVLLGVPQTLFGVKRSPYFFLAKIWAKISTMMFAVRLEVEGLEKIKPGKNYVFMGNHQSYVDIFTMLSILDKNFLFMAKKELFKIPFFGYAIKQMGLIPIHRGESREALKSLFDAAKKIQEGYSVLLFPEGTRNNNQEMLPFKRGAFVLAARTGQEIAPFIIEGSGDALPKDSFRIRPFKKVRVRFLDPVNLDGMKDRDALPMIRERMENAQKELRCSGAGK